MRPGPHPRLAREMLRQSASRLLRASGLTAPPYEPSLVAARLGIPIHDKETPGVDGYVELVGDRATIVLNRTAPATRKRFTLAHELGHIMLMREIRRLRLELRRYKSGIPRVGGQADPVEERLCNDFAAELLMPLVDVRAFWRRRLVSPASLRECAETFHVSLSAACTRAVDSGAAAFVTFWDTEPWPLVRWSCGPTPGVRIRRAVDAVVISLGGRSESQVLERILPDGILLRAAPCGRRSILVVLTSVRKDRATLVDRSVEPPPVGPHPPPHRAPLAQPALPGLFRD